MSSEKKCSACQIEQSLDSFPRDARTRDKRRSDCRNCCNRRVQTFRTANRVRLADERQNDRKLQWTKYRAREITKKYGISWEMYLEWHARGRCDICGATDPRSRWGVFSLDHDHANGNVRGLLCSPCNTGLGNFKDTPDNLRAAANYLDRTSNFLRKAA